MNLYGVDAGEQSFVDVIDEWGGPREYYQAIDLFPAETRGQARAKACQRFRIDYMEPMRVILLWRDYEPANCACDDTDMWMIFSSRLEPDKFDELVWQQQIDFEEND